MNYVLSCCSTADLSPEHFAARNIQYICFHYELDGVSYPDDLGQTIPFDRFYQAMVDGATTKTSQVNVDEYLAYFRSFLEQGKDIVHLSLSSGISGSVNSARIAKEMLETEYPEREIYIIDSLAASSGYGLLMDQLADLRDAGLTACELAQWAEEHKKQLHHWFFTTDLTFFIKGGRVSKVSGWFGTALNICPLLNVSNEGKLIARHKHRGKKKVMEAIVNQMEAHAMEGTDYSGKCYMCHSACEEDARRVAAMIEERFPKLSGKVEINNVGTTIGSHTGPGTIAVFFWGDERVD